MRTTDLLVAPPAPDRTRLVLERMGELLDANVAWLYQRRYHFALGDGWTIALSPESAGRFRLEACRWTRPAATLWARAGDEDRLAGLVLELAAEIEGVREGV